MLILLFQTKIHRFASPSFLNSSSHFSTTSAQPVENPKAWWFVMKEEEDYVRKGNDHHDGNKGSQYCPIEHHFT
jgi:hypothetical protein